MAEIKAHDKKAELWKALLGAQEAISSVTKDAKNDWGKYGYTSAEEMIGQCRKALLANGLVFTRTNWGVNGDIVHCDFVIAHPESGQTVEFGNVMTVVASKNPDKAVLAALTTVLNYTLRDLLLIPRVDEKQPEIDNRAHDELVTPARKPRPVKKQPAGSPDWLAKSFNVILGEKPDPDEYVKRLLGAAEQKYECDFKSVSDLPEEYLLKVFEHHGWTVNLIDNTVNKEGN